MQRTRMVIKKGFIALSIMVLSSIMPAATLFADPSCTPPDPSSYGSPGVHTPTGSDAVTYTYVCDPSSPYAGDWVNPYYVYNPNTDTTTPLYAPNYSYDCTTGVWTKDRWAYDPSAGVWNKRRVVTSAPQGVATNCPVVAAADPSTTSSSDPSAANNASTVSNTGPNSTNSSNTSGTNNLTLNNGNTATVNNNLSSVANSGNALVLSNTTGGDATSGGTQDTQNVANLLQSSDNSLGQGGNVVTFTYNINGDVNGDILLDPATLSSVQGTGPNSTNSANSNLNNNLTVNNSTNAGINNNVSVASASGNATVANNTNGGNATSGNAEAIANIINIIDSAISAGQSFIGTININGNLNGNILLPPDFINQMLAANIPTVTITAPNSSNSSTSSTNNTTTITNTNNQGINNTVNATTKSGNATVSNNTSAGNANSGNATTTLTAFNLTGSRVIGANDLLVFVNVTGTWVGLILNAPAGATAAEFGGGITSTGPNSTNSTNSSVNNNATINNTNNDQINNNVNCNAQTGNATVRSNTKAGNASSGNADCAVNLLNMEDSTLSLSGWFGILFINVFGTWHGNFGVATPASQSGSSGGVFSPVLAFVPHAAATSGSNGGNGFTLDPFSSFGGSTTSGPSTASAILAAATTKGQTGHRPTSTPGHINWLMVSSSVSLFAIYVLGESYYSIRQKRHQLA